MPNIGDDLVFELYFFDEDGDPVTSHTTTVEIKDPAGNTIAVSPNTATQIGHGFFYTLDGASVTAEGLYECYGTPSVTLGLIVPYALATVVVEAADAQDPVLAKLNTMITGSGPYAFTSDALVNTPIPDSVFTPEDVEAILAMAITVDAIKAKTDLIVDGTTPIYLFPVPGPQGTTLFFFKGDTYRNAIIITAFDDYGTVLNDDITYSLTGFTFIVRDASKDDDEEALFEVEAVAYSEHSVRVPLLQTVETTLLDSKTKYIYQVQATYKAGGTRTIAHGVVNVLTNANP